MQMEDNMESKKKTDKNRASEVKRKNKAINVDPEHTKPILDDGHNMKGFTFK
jgi:hypothetical protein